MPFGLAPCLRTLAGLGFEGQVRLKAGQRCLTDNGNHIVDCRIPPLDDPEATDATIRAIPGVVGTGLFLDMRPTVIIQRPGAIEFPRRRTCKLTRPTRSLPIQHTQTVFTMSLPVSILPDMAKQPGASRASTPARPICR